jgi:hypothetical protein
MNKHFLSVGLGLAALFAGSQATTTKPAQPNGTPKAPDLEQSRDMATKSWPADIRARKSAPVKPAAPVAKQRVEVVARPMALMGSPFSFPQVPTRRKVKYGKSRWVVLG